MQWGGGIKYINTFSKENGKREREKDDPLKARRGELVIANLCNVFNMTKTFSFLFPDSQLSVEELRGPPLLGY
jgi:hypothetical protein